MHACAGMCACAHTHTYPHKLITYTHIHITQTLMEAETGELLGFSSFQLSQEMQTSDLARDPTSKYTDRKGHPTPF